MVRRKFIVVLLMLGCCIKPSACGIFNTLGSLFSSIGAGVIDQTYCRYSECCNDRGVPIAMWELEVNLEKNLHGQHIVMQRLIPALEAHLTREISSRKPLVLSFQGPSGTGKNYVSQMIAEALYAKGVNSKFVRYYRGRADFPIAANVDEYNERIRRDVSASLASCARSLFIFDEVDNMPQGIFKALSSLVDYHTNIDGYDSSKAIVILLSNNGGEHISDRLGNLIKDGTLRAETKMKEFEQILKKAAYNLDGGMKKSTLIDAYVIDHYLPFLPLEKEHVEKCILAEFKRRKFQPRADDIDIIVRESVEYDPKYGIFVMSGCKTIAPKVAMIAHSNSKLEL